MEIIIHFFEKKFADSDYKKAADEYIKRIRPFCKITLVFHKQTDLNFTDSASAVYLLSPKADTISSPELAEHIKSQNLSGISRMEFILTDKKHAEESNLFPACTNTIPFSVSSFSMSQELTAVVLLEQLYRAYTILNNITYHK